MDFHPQRKGSFVSGSGRLCQISSKSVQNCDRESTDTQTDRQTDTHTEKTQVILLSVPCYAIAMGQITKILVVADCTDGLLLAPCGNNCQHLNTTCTLEVLSCLPVQANN